MSMPLIRPLLAGVSYFGGSCNEKGLMRFRTNTTTNVLSGKDVRTRHGVDISKRPSQEGLALPHGRSVMKFEDSVDDEVESLDTMWRSSKNSNRSTRVDNIRSMLESMNEGEISASAYDTAWVALVEDIDQKGRPQFPTAIEWIAENQLEDGSWGDPDFFSYYDRILCTLACVVALTSWKIHPDKCGKGIIFLKENISKLKGEDEMLMPVGFEITLPSLIKIARDLEIEIPLDHPALQEIYARREIKLSRIPKDLLHKVPTTMLFSLEGMQMEVLNWEMILRFQCDDGSFFVSPSSTAFAFMETKERGCLNFLNDVVQRFNGGVPNAYPVEIFERMWVTDRLQRLGISRYFREKLEEFMAYVSRHWTKDGLSWTRKVTVCDVDDTSMGFRLLRLYGHEVSPDVFENFKRDGKFFTYAGQSNESVTGIYNLFRSSHLRFLGESILESAHNYSSRFLTEKREANDLSDKWIISKGLPSEVGYALDVPFYASLPRLETRLYLEQYGGDSDVWIGKAYYRMPNVNNNAFLELAKIDYNICQSLHLSEWNSIQRWFSDWKLEEFGVTQKIILHSFFVPAATIFEEERSRERIAWAKSALLVKAIVSRLGDPSLYEHRKMFVREFNERIEKQNFFDETFYANERTNHVLKGLTEAMIGILDELSLEMFEATGRDIKLALLDLWDKWTKGWEEDGEINKGIVELLAQTIFLFGDGDASSRLQEKSSYPHYQRLCDLTNDISIRLARYQKHKVINIKGHLDGEQGIKDSQIDSEMQELSKLVFQDVTPGIDRDTKMMFFDVIRGFYYTTYFDDTTIDQHVAKVLFEKVN